jgi:hypothetical protein
MSGDFGSATTTSQTIPSSHFLSCWTLRKPLSLFELFILYAVLSSMLLLTFATILTICTQHVYDAADVHSMPKSKNKGYYPPSSVDALRLKG